MTFNIPNAKEAALQAEQINAKRLAIELASRKEDIEHTVKAAISEGKIQAYINFMLNDEEKSALKQMGYTFRIYERADNSMQYHMIVFNN